MLFPCPSQQKTAVSGPPVHSATAPHASRLTLLRISPMAYYNDFSPYAYDAQFARPGTRNIGWLNRAHSFPKAQSSCEVLDLLWTFCSTSVAPQRGGHDCEFCPSGSAYLFERKGQRLLLGAAEIRVFSDKGHIYASPNLIYHYVLAHRYLPPDEFLEALRKGPRPPREDYFERLSSLGLTWSPAPSGEGLRRAGHAGGPRDDR
jgi:hypothetical protein